MRFCLAIGFLLSFYGQVLGQQFDDEAFRTNQALVDSFYAMEAYPELEKALDSQIGYLIETERYDSIHDFVYKIGRAKAQLGKVKEGIDESEYLLGLIQKETTDSSDILYAINELSWVYYEAGLDSMCLATDLRYLDFCSSYANANVMERSDAHYNVGFDYQVVGNTPKAIYHFTEAVKTIEEDTVSSLLSKRVDCYNALGAAYWKYGNMNKAKEALRKSGDLSLDLEDTVMAKFYASNAIGNLSLAYEDEGNLAKSMELLEEAIELRKQSLPYVTETYDKDIQRKHLISNYHNLAALYLSIGDLERALAMADYAYVLYEDFFPDDDSRRIAFEESKGSIYAAAGDYQTAEGHLKKSLDLTIEEYGEVNYHALNRHQRLGELYMSWGNHEKALHHINRTIAIAGETSDEVSSKELAMAYQYRAMTKKELGDHQGANSDLIKSASIHTAGFGAGSTPVGEIWLERAKVYLSANDRDSAEFFLERALGIFEANRTKNQNTETNNYSGIVRMLPEALLMKAGFTAKGDTQSLLAALEYLESSLTYLREERRNFDSDGSQLGFIDEHAANYAEAAQISYELYELTGKEPFRDDVLRYAEERKTVLLKRQLNKFGSLRVAQVPDSIIAKERVLIKQLSDPENKLEYGDLESEFDALISHIRERYPDYYDLRYDAATASIPDIQEKLLSEGQSLIEYIETGDGLMAFVITRENSKLVELDGLGIKEEIEDFNSSLIGRNNSAGIRISGLLRNKLFEPLQPYLDGREVFIVPDGPLYALNFEALSGDDGSGFLIEDYTISYLLSATTSLLYQDLSEKTLKSGVLAMAPGFEHGENTSGSGEKFIRQPFAMQTAKVIGDIFSGKSLLAAQATEDRFKELASENKIIHLGTHTEINTTSPMLSRLILSRSEKEDGYLHAYEIYNLPLRAELAVLTACETGVGKESSSEGVLSMAHGFAYAGCPSLVMSLWEIDEKTSAQIVESFYLNLSEGMAKNEALRKAKLDYLKEAKGELKNPYYWSGLVLFGNPAPVEPASSPLLWLVLGAALLLVLAVAFFSKRKKPA